MKSRRLISDIGLPPAVPPPVGLRHAQPAAGGPASPWAGPESFRIEGGCWHSQASTGLRLRCARCRSALNPGLTPRQRVHRNMTSAKPIWRFVYDLAPYHGHSRLYIADADFLHHEWVGTQDCHIREFTRLQRALSILVEGQKSVVVCRAAKRFSARECLIRRHALTCDAVLAGDRLPDRPEHRHRHVVGYQAYLDAGIEQIA